MSLSHAHVYFELSQRSLVDKLIESIDREKPPIQLYRLHLKRVGPHALPMAELHINEDDRNAAIDWLRANHEGLSVLIHQDTGDDHRDHSQNVLWLGVPLPIDFGFFDLVKERPDLAVHPKSGPA